MKNDILKILLFLTCIFASAQSERRVLNGKIINDSLSVNKIHIINKTSEKGTISDKNGEFQIPVRVNDTLIFSGVQYKVKYKVISKSDLQQIQVFIKLEPFLNKLDEVLIKPVSVAKRLNLPNADKKPLTNLEARLHGHSKANLPLTILGTLLGKKGGINNIYYIASGKRKKDRKLQKLINEDKLKGLNEATIIKIKQHFKNDFFIYTLKIPSKEIDNFIEYCVQYNIIKLFNDNKLLEATELMLKHSKKYLSQNKE